MARARMIGVAMGLLAACGGDGGSDPDARAYVPTPDAPTTPYVVSVSPTDGAEDVEGDVVIDVVFSEPMDVATINETTLAMSGSAGAVSGTVTLDFDGTTAHFRTTDELTALASCSVTIAAEVADVAGHAMGTPFVWSFSVAEQWWHPPVQFQPAGDTPKVGCDDANNLMAAWVEPSGVRAARRVGSIWSAPETLGGGTGVVNALELDVAPDGDAILGWYEAGVWVRQYRAGSGWEAVTQVNDGGGISVAIASNNDAMVLSTDIDLLASRYTTAGGWGTPSVIVTDLVVGGGSLAIADSGNAIALWQQSDTFAYYHWMSEFTVGSGWGAPTPLGTEPSGDAAVAFAPNGDAIVVWTEGDATWSISAKRFVAGVGWSALTVLSSGSNIPFSSSVAMDSAGNATVTWAHDDPAEVVARRLDAATGTWEPATTFAVAGQLEVTQVANGGGDDVFAVWEEDPFSDARIFAAHRGTSWSAASSVEDLGDSQGWPTLAACPNGTAIVMWAEQDAGIYASEYR